MREFKSLFGGDERFGSRSQNSAQAVEPPYTSRMREQVRRFPSRKQFSIHSWTPLGYQTFVNETK